MVHSFCCLINEVAKQKDGTDYPGKTLYNMIISIQKFFSKNNVFLKLIGEQDFHEVRVVLANVMKEQQNIGSVKKQVNFIPMEFENILWKKCILGGKKPDKPQDTVLFLLGNNFGLRAVDKHSDLRHDSKEKPLQLSFEHDPSGTRCLVYRIDSVTKTNNRALKE